MMPPLPPRIAALPRTKSGLPVPYVAQWEGEERLRVAFDPHVRAEALFSSPRRDGGDATLGLMEVSRQREVVSRGLCQVCRARLDPRDRFVAGLFEPTRDRGQLIREPWCCTACLAFALRVCPGLLRARRDANLTVIRMSKWVTVLAETDVAGLVGEGSLDADATERPLVYGYAKIKPAASSHVLTVEQFLRSFG